MAAPDSSHELSVVEGEVEASASESIATPDPEPRPAVVEPEPTPPEASKRRGAPWWLVIVVAVIGLVFFLYQYQRAEGLDGRVTSLTEELLATDQRLQVANGHIASHQVHLDLVRSGVADLSDQVAGLQALAGRDPLAPPPPVASVSATAVEETVVEASPEPVAEVPSTSSAAAKDEDGYFWRAEETPQSPAPVDTAPPSADSERLSIIRGAVATPFAER